MPRRLALWFASLLLPGCSDFRECAEPPALATAPARLSETGLYADLAAGTLAAGVRAYEPEFALWSDGADKERWIQLPPGAVIDARDPDAWRFPAGTRLWKEFRRDGVRVETRMLEKLADEEWLALAYVWAEDGSDAFASPEGETDALGTPHDVPPAKACAACHGGTASGALGFSAIQLARPALPGELGLAELIDEGLIEPPPPRPQIPGDAAERAALGYLHANCGHCHNQARPPRAGPRCYDPENELDFLLRVDGGADVTATPTYRTAVGSVIKPGRPDHSALVRRISRRDDAAMPPLATEVVDPEGLEVVRAWISAMP
ncbi:MAG: hypothetical protein R3B09_24250 [Nannocystaceae bacterium]